MSSRRFLLLFAIFLLLSYGLENLVFAWDLDEGISIQHTSTWMNQWLLQAHGIKEGEWIRLFTWPWIHDLNRIHFGFNFFFLLGLHWFIPQISIQRLLFGWLLSWLLSTLFFLLFAPSSHYLLGSSHWIFFIWGLTFSHRNKTYQIGLPLLGFIFILISYVFSGWMSGSIHLVSFFLGMFLNLKRRSELVAEPKNHDFLLNRLSLIQQKINKSGFESLLLEEKQIWKEAHGKVD